jgi:hypothetical protein
MYLTAQNLFYYLRDYGLATPDDVAAGTFGVVELGRRNRNFMVMGPATGSLFVKQVPGVMAETIISFRREAACAQLAHGAGEESALWNVAPRLRRYDPARHVLVYEAYEGSQTLTEHVRDNGGAMPEGVAGRLARTLAACHLETGRTGALLPVAPVLAADVPWVFTMGERAEQVMPAMSGGCRQVVEAIRAAPELLHGLAALGAGWRRVALMHGDFKWDNVLVVQAPDGGRELRLIDWELADLGDPLWDVAGGLGGFIQYWLLNLPQHHLAAPLHAGADAPVALATVHALAREFWSAWRHAVRHEQPVTDELELLAGRLTGARLVLLAFELLQAAPALTPHAATALQLGRYLLAHPRNAMADLLGIGPAAAPADGVDADDAAPWKLDTPTTGRA